MSESVTSRVEPAAAIKSAEHPHRPPPRSCKVCDAPAAAGAYWCRDCKGLL
ncbi:hypothetical protein [Rhodococcus sp. YH1]|uniref:hypothetical protein n=1 Tax=Rhodococcus sp. YH1 TaxID=89066 RepID=UPI001386ABE7|nr:hypothetical protein [Rhodococcus sp. YH1]